MTGERLTHTPDGFIRSMQISSKKVFVFAEGKSDRFFYDRLCERAYGNDVGYEITTVQEVRVKAPGKAGLVEWFTYLRAQGALCSVFKGKKFVSVFVADKDVDDIVETAIRSEHWIYTEFYCLENHLVAHGDLPKALAAATMLSESEVRAALGQPQAWRQRAAHWWKDWVTLCVFARRHGLNCGISFSRNRSQIHPADGYTPLDMKLREAHLATMHATSGMDLEDFLERLALEEQIIDGLFAAGRHDVVFNGKWYVEFAAADAKRIAAGRSHDTTHLPDKLFQMLAMTVDFEGSGWVSRTIIALRKLLDCPVEASPA